MLVALGLLTALWTGNVAAVGVVVVLAAVQLATAALTLRAYRAGARAHRRELSRLDAHQHALDQAAKQVTLVERSVAKVLASQTTAAATQAIAAHAVAELAEQPRTANGGLA